MCHPRFPRSNRGYRRYDAVMHCFSGTTRRVTVGNDSAQMSVGHQPATQAKAPRLLLLHGNPASMTDWCDLASELRGRFEVLAMDLPGFGGSDIAPTPGRTRLDIAADCALAVARDAGWDAPFYVVGHSHGAAVALVMAAREPQVVAGVVLLASLSTRAHLAYRQLALPGVQTLLRIPAALVRRESMRPLTRRVVSKIMAPMFAPAPLSDERVDAQLRAFARRPSVLLQMARVASENPSAQLRHEVPRVSAPVLQIHGGGDNLVPLAHAQHLGALLRSTTSIRFESLENAGHMLHRSHAAVVRALLDAWIGERAQGFVQPEVVSR